MEAELEPSPHELRKRLKAETEASDGRKYLHVGYLYEYADLPGETYYEQISFRLESDKCLWRYSDPDEGRGEEEYLIDCEFVQEWLGSVCLEFKQAGY